MIEQVTHIDLEKFHFLRDQHFKVLCISIVLIVIGFFFYRESNAWKKSIAKHLQPYVIQKGTSWKPRLIKLSVILMFVLGSVSFLGPTWNQVKSPEKKIKSQLIIALDLSTSMLTSDVSPSRLERAKFKIYDFLSANPRAETNLLVFAGSTHTAIPFTTDYRIIEDQIKGLKPRMMPVQGTAFNSLFRKIDTLFTNNKAEGKVLLITDDLEDLSIETVSNFLQQNNVKIYLYPFATQIGSFIPNTKEKSSLNLQKLNSLNAMQKLEILEITLDNSDVKDLAEAISDTILFDDQSKEDQEDWQDNGYWLLIPLVFVFLFSFRKGWSLCIILLMITLNSCSGNLSLESSNFVFKDLWFTKEYQAQQAYNQEDYSNAAQDFLDPLRKGIAYYKSGDYLSAERAFENDTTITGLYNLGLTYAKLGKLEQAKIMFEKVLEQDPNNSNASNNIDHLTGAIAELEQMDIETVSNEEGNKAENSQNDSPEDLSGGGQEATKKDMEKERKEETQETDVRKGKELDELPDDFKSGNGELPKNILLRKVDDDPALFLTKKFSYQVRKKQVVTEKTIHKW
ncbi:VWA domain-containing protein [Lacinutrix jangbogonensis]|uniref:VWA domain-containing protein n=1 Tax=Lacinutrix jangbogonensis TaxID=1469557 RepID=UPI00068B6501|nr:VWA domain-containing protein [Lacinutrix jangbogonensis]